VALQRTRENVQGHHDAAAKAIEIRRAGLTAVDALMGRKRALWQRKSDFWGKTLNAFASTSGVSGYPLVA